MSARHKQGAGAKAPAPFKKYKPGSAVNFTRATLHKNIIANITRPGQKFVMPLPLSTMREEPLIIVGGGPSVRHDLDIIREGKNVHGAKIMAVNGSHDFLIGNGIVPDYHAMMDANPIVAEYVRNPRRDVIYLVASQCNPCVFDALQGYETLCWHVIEGMGEEKILSDYLGTIHVNHGTGEIVKKPGKIANIAPWVYCDGGCSIVLRVPRLGWYMGFREFHFFGVDSSYEEKNQQHAYSLPGDGYDTVICRIGDDKGRNMRADANAKTYITSQQLMKQALGFRDMVQQWHERFNGCELYVYGSGLAVDLLQAQFPKMEVKQDATA